MAHKHPKKVKLKDVQNETTSSLNEQTDDNLAQAVNELSVNCTSTSRGQSRLPAASCATNLSASEDETPVKSFKRKDKTTAVDPPSTGAFLSDRQSLVTDIDRRQVQPPFTQNIQPRLPVQPSESDSDQAQRPNSLSTIPEMENSSSMITLSNISWTGLHSQQLPLDMNIPPSLNQPRVENTEISVGFAEQQPSFRTTSTVCSHLSPITRGAEGWTCPPPEQISRESFSPNSQLSPYSSEDNSHNLSVSTLWGHPHMTAKPAPMSAQMGPSNGYNYRGDSNGGPGDYGRQFSSSSLRSFINDTCLVKNLPWTIINHVDLTLTCKDSTNSWKVLVEYYGWDYERTRLFENKRHNEGIFFSLLQEPEFQIYTLKQLQYDLDRLPRKDILSDLNYKIREHNAEASRQDQ